MVFIFKFAPTLEMFDQRLINNSCGYVQRVDMFSLGADLGFIRLLVDQQYHQRLTIFPKPWQCEI